MANGNMGKMLFVNLSNGEIKEEVPDESLYRDYVGGYGIGSRVLYSRQKAGVDPLGPENIFGIIAGPLTASGMPFGSRYTVVCKSPLTGGWGDANSGGDFGAYLKFSGYDAIFFEGISPTPVYLLVQDGKAELKDASHLWGKDTFVTEDELRAAHGGKKIGVGCIGPAAEKLSYISSFMNNKGRAAARSGVGAVVGSKKLKAIVVSGNNKVALADSALLAESRKAHLDSIPPADMARRRKYGTSAGGYGNAHTGGSPVKNWGGVGIVDFPDIQPLHGDNVNKTTIKPYSCYHCPAACGAHMAAGTEYEYEEGAHRPEYETWAAFGTMCLNNNVESIIKCNDLCNRYGIDTISAGATVAFAIECYEKGLITKEDTGGLELTWGNHKSIVALTEMMGKREGIGDVLADGTKVAAEKIGKGAEAFAVHVGGQEPGMHDPKLRTGVGAAYKLDATPGRHMQGGSASLEGGARMIGIDVEPVDKFDWGNKGEAHKAGSAWRHIINAAGLCCFGVGNGLDANVIANAITAATGIKYTVNDLLKAGDRIASLRNSFNIREGISAADVYMNPRMYAIAKEEGPTKGVTVDLDAMAKGYFKAIGWDEQTGKPSKETLMNLGLDDVAEDLYRE